MRVHGGRRRRSARVRIGRTVLAVSLALAGFVLAAAFVGVTAQGNALARDIAGAHVDIAAEQALHRGLQDQINRQKSSSYVEEKARDYGFIRPNESLITVQRNEQPSEGLSRVVSEGPSRIARWFAFFFGSR